MQSYMGDAVPARGATVGEFLHLLCLRGRYITGQRWLLQPGGAQMALGKKDGTTVQSPLPGLEYKWGFLNARVCVCVCHRDGGGYMQVVITSVVSTHSESASNL